ncbi:MAG: biopolymer transporter ExbD [Bacteroidetes bacterium]|nr:biopolymer transporter ExbD [Bacteroidota bacterium]
MKFETSNKPLEIFSFSSLTDIVMLLLIFFLITSQFVVQTGVKVKLPGAQNNEQLIQSNLIITLTDKNRIYVGTKEVGIDALAGEILKTNPQFAKSNLIIRADKSVNIDMVIQVIDKAKGLGVDKFTIETKKITN